MRIQVSTHPVFAPRPPPSSRLARGRVGALLRRRVALRRRGVAAVLLRRLVLANRLGRHHGAALVVVGRGVLLQLQVRLRLHARLHAVGGWVGGGVAGGQIRVLWKGREVDLQAVHDVAGDARV